MDIPYYETYIFYVREIVTNQEFFVDINDEIEDITSQITSCGFNQD